VTGCALAKYDRYDAVARVANACYRRIVSTACDVASGLHCGLQPSCRRCRRVQTASGQLWLHVRAAGVCFTSCTDSRPHASMLSANALLLCGSDLRVQGERQMCGSSAGARYRRTGYRLPTQSDGKAGWLGAWNKQVVQFMGQGRAGPFILSSQWASAFLATANQPSTPTCR
jgi:hypothetical protein